MLVCCGEWKMGEIGEMLLFNLFVVIGLVNCMSVLNLVIKIVLISDKCFVIVFLIEKGCVMGDVVDYVFKEMN